MKTSLVERQGLTRAQLDLVVRLVEKIPYDHRRQAMGDVVHTLLEGRARLAEDALGWGRHIIELGMHEHRTGIRCIQDLSNRGSKRAEIKNPQLLVDIEMIMEPHCESDSHLRTTLLHSNMTTNAVLNALGEKGYTTEELPSERSMCNILNRLGYRLKTVAKSKVQKNKRNG